MLPPPPPKCQSFYPVFLYFLLNFSPFNAFFPFFTLFSHYTGISLHSFFSFCNYFYPFYSFYLLLLFYLSFLFFYLSFLNKIIHFYYYPCKMLLDNFVLYKLLFLYSTIFLTNLRVTVLKNNLAGHQKCTSLQNLPLLQVGKRLMLLRT